METSNYILFFGSREGNKFCEFSQWYRIEFKCDGIKYFNMEQFMMSQKALLFNDIESRDRIMSTTNPGYIKSLGRLVKNFDVNIWDENKYEIILRGNRCKFTQNENLLRLLMSTGDKIIGEASKYDRVYGIGLTDENAKNLDHNDWPGDNLLGKCLMQIRQENR